MADAVTTPEAPLTPADFGARALEAPSAAPPPPPTPADFGATPVAHEDTFFWRFATALGRSMAQVQAQHEAEIKAVDPSTPLVTVSPQAVRNFSLFAAPGTAALLKLAPNDVREGVEQGAANLATGLTTPGTAVIGAATAVQPEIGIGVLSGLAAKSAGSKLGEASVAAQQGDRKEAARLTTEALGEGAMAVAPALHVALKAPAVEAPPVLGKQPVETPAVPQVELKLNAPKVEGTDVPLPTSATPSVQAATRLAASPQGSFMDTLRTWMRSSANESLPRITEAHRESGELGVRLTTAARVGREMGDIFAENVLRGLDVNPREFGAFVVEDNLRSRVVDLLEQADKATTPEDAQLLRTAADAVGTIVGAEGSPFPTEESWLDYWNRPEVQEAARRHRDMWAEQKDPIYRQANDLDPETPLASRGMLSGVRINMKAIREGEASPTALPVRDSLRGVERIAASEDTPSGRVSRPDVIRQMATLRKSDPFAKGFTGLGSAYEADYAELLRHGFGRELPVAAQHAFIKSMVDNGVAVLSDSSFEPDLTINGEPTVNRLQSMRPWTGRYLHLPKSLANEYDAAVGMSPSFPKLPVLHQLSQLATVASTWGLGEGTTHFSNLLTGVITGAGPTSNPLLNGLIKSFSGRADLLYTLPRVFIKALTANRQDVLDLTAIGAIKEPYKGPLGKVLLNPADKGVRLVAAELYDNFAKAGWIEPTETGKREFINQVGNYNSALQAPGIRLLRETGVQPFATAVHTFNVMGLRRMFGSAGLRGLTPTQRMAFAADVYGGWIGFVTLLTGLNYMLNRNDQRVANPVLGPTGTGLGQVGWLDDEGKPKTFNLANMMGYARGLRATGVLPAADALNRGLPATEALDAGGQAVAQTGLNYVTGPLVRTAYVAATGSSPSLPSIKQAPPVPPSAPDDPFSPLKSKLIMNTATALQQANPAIDAVLHGIESFTPAGEKLGMGPQKSVKSMDDVLTFLDELGTKQLSRFYPRSTTGAQSKENFAEIVTKARLNEYLDDVVRKARRLPEEDRFDYLDSAVDQVPEDLQKQAKRRLKERGAYKGDQ